jgi:hypothetical protein
LSPGPAPATAAHPTPPSAPPQPRPHPRRPTSPPPNPTPTPPHPPTPQVNVVHILAIGRLMNQAVGDAISGLLLVEAVLRCGTSLEAWEGLYADLPSRQVGSGARGARRAGRSRPPGLAPRRSDCRHAGLPEGSPAHPRAPPALLIPRARPSSRSPTAARSRRPTPSASASRRPACRPRSTRRLPRCRAAARSRGRRAPRTRCACTPRPRARPRRTASRPTWGGSFTTWPAASASAREPRAHELRALDRRERVAAGRRWPAAALHCASWAA